MFVPKIQTSYYANWRNFNNDAVPISISRYTPKWYNCIQYSKLAPSESLLKMYKETYDIGYYIETYMKETLSRLKSQSVYRDLLILSDNRPVILLCYEKSEDFCHRHLVSDGFNQNGIFCKEL